MEAADRLPERPEVMIMMTVMKMITGNWIMRKMAAVMRKWMIMRNHMSMTIVQK